MATVNSLITSPTPLVNTSISSGTSQGSVTTGTYTNTTGKYLLVVAIANRPPKINSNYNYHVYVRFNINNGGGGLAFTISNLVPDNGIQSLASSATFVLAPNQGFSVTHDYSGDIGNAGATANSCQVIGFSLSPSF